MSGIENRSGALKKQSGDLTGNTTRPRTDAEKRQILSGRAKDFLRKIGDNDPETTLDGLYLLYKKIERTSPYLLPQQRQFFPENPKERTLERYFGAFEYIYAILKDASERARLKNGFDVFWEKCEKYLEKCHYPEGMDFMARGELFYRHSFSFWRKEFVDDEAGLDKMFEYFRACFGIVGNDDYCRVDLGVEVTYDWRKMKACHRALSNPPGSLWKPERTEKEKWLPETVQKLRELRSRLDAKIEVDTAAADALLEEIAQKNRERGIN